MSGCANNSAVDESLCTNCGKCCYKKLIIGRNVYITPFPCEFLDTETNLCTIYEKRHELNPLCLTMEQGMKVSAFPADCGYVPTMAPEGYNPAREDYNWKKEWRGFDIIAEDLDVSDHTYDRVIARGPDAPPMYVEANAMLDEKRKANGGVLNLADLVRKGGMVDDDVPLNGPAADKCGGGA